jgi:endonuclease YncB( thermonuclease family)
VGAASFAQQPAAGIVERVVDGDTIVINGVGPVRLIGIDAPEIGGNADPAVARQAAEAVRLLAEGVSVRLEVNGALQRWEVRRSQEDVFSTFESWKAAMVEKGWLP